MTELYRKSRDLHVLIVEGENMEEWEKIGEFLSRQKGITLHISRKISEAYKVLRTGDINVVIADYDRTGPRVFRYMKQFKALKPYVEIVLLSARATLSEAIRAMKEGAYDFYETPVTGGLLMTIIGKIAEKQSLYFEMKELEGRVKDQFEFNTIIGRSKAIDHVLHRVKSVAKKDINVLLSGETGTGKELIANAIHYNSPRATKPFIKVNCAAFGEGVLESELFGHEKGAFTGAIAQRVGRFELADEGTLFLDEVGDIPPATQIKLLRILQEREFERVGGNETRRVNVRIIAATNRDLEALMREGRFRVDLYYRLSVMTIDIPSLRERKEDIPLLVSHFINKFVQEKGYSIRGITREAMRLLVDYSWPGNIRELENAVESSMALAEGDRIDARYMPAFLLLRPSEERDFYHIPKDMKLKEIENEIIRLALERTGGNRTKTARMLGIGLRTLQRKLSLR